MREEEIKQCDKCKEEHNIGGKCTHYEHPQITLGCFDTPDEAEEMAIALYDVFEKYKVESEINIAELRTAKKTGKKAWLVFMSSYELDDTLKLKTINTLKIGE